MISKVILSAVALFLVVGCASGGPKRPTVFADKNNNIPADIPSQFDSRYERFISKNEMKEFQGLQTDEERQKFIDKFWTDRDPNPQTLENEEKQRIDQLIDDIASERFFSGSGTNGLLFRSNGGFRGHMAHVYLLHGEPAGMDVIEGVNFVDLMLWIYLDERGNDIRYAFLFYQKGSSGSFSLFPQDNFRLDPCGAINEIGRLTQFSGRMERCGPDTDAIIQELSMANGKSGTLDGYLFAWALFNFSSDGLIAQGAALDAPKPASEVAKMAGARVVGEAPERVGTSGTDFFFASCDKCRSFIPVELKLGERFTISGPVKNFDWLVKGEYLQLSLKHKIILENSNSTSPIVIEGITVQGVKKGVLSEAPETILTFDLVDPSLISGIPPGTYQVSIYIKNPLTGKYNAWVREFTK